MKGLTGRQSEILECVRATLAERGYPPTLREIGLRFGMTSTNAVADHLKALETKGYIKRDPLKARSIQVLTPPPVGMQGLPAPRTGRPAKGADERKGDFIRVRVTSEQKDILSAAAERAGLDVSSWLRTIGLREAQRSGAPRPTR